MSLREALLARQLSNPKKEKSRVCSQERTATSELKNKRKIKMLSSINAVRPYSVNNYSGRNSAKSQPAFGSVASVVASEVAEQGAKEGAGFFRKVGRFLDNARYDLGANAAFLITFLHLESCLPSASMKEKVMLGVVCKAGAEISSLMGHFMGVTAKKGWHDRPPLSISHHPLSPVALAADVRRIIAKSVE